MLSDPEFVEASRLYVAVRLDPYEDEENARVVEQVAGELRNAGAFIAPPDASQFIPLARVRRAARGDLAAGMRWFAQRFPPNDTATREPGPVPWLQSVYEALNIAHCDARPLVVLVPEKSGPTTTLDARLRAFAWSPEFVGRFHYVQVSRSVDTRKISGFTREPGIYFVQPTDYGLQGTVLAQLPLTTDRTALEARARATLTTFAQNHDPLARDEHVMTGRFWGIRWAEGVPSYQGTVQRETDDTAKSE